MFKSTQLNGLVAAVFLMFSLSAFATGIPVVDGAAIANSKMEHFESIAKYVEQIAQLKSQLEQMERQYEALTGSRNLGKILYDSRFRQYLPEDWKGVYDAVRNGGYAGLSGDAAAIRAAVKRFDACQHITDSVRKASCEARAAKGAVDKAFALKAFDMAKERIGQIEGLMNQISSTEDPKAIAELQARIAIEQAALANEDTKLRMLQMVAAAEDRLIRQQQEELTAQERSRTKGIELEAIDW
jgi:type IV secretion system protein VirB5